MKYYVFQNKHNRQPQVKGFVRVINVACEDVVVHLPTSQHPNMGVSLLTKTILETYVIYHFQCQMIACIV